MQPPCLGEQGGLAVWMWLHHPSHAGARGQTLALFILPGQIQPYRYRGMVWHPSLVSEQPSPSAIVHLFYPGLRLCFLKLHCEKVVIELSKFNLVVAWLSGSFSAHRTPDVIIFHRRQNKPVCPALLSVAQVYCLLGFLGFGCFVWFFFSP